MSHITVIWGNFSNNGQIRLVVLDGFTSFGMEDAGNHIIGVILRNELYLEIVCAYVWHFTHYHVSKTEK